MTPEQQAVIDAAEQVARVNGWRLDPATPGYELTELGVLVAAVRAYRAAADRLAAPEPKEDD